MISKKLLRDQGDRGWGRDSLCGCRGRKRNQTKNADLIALEGKGGGDRKSSDGLMENCELTNCELRIYKK